MRKQLLDKQWLFLESEQHLLEDDQPSHYFRDLAANGWFDETYPFTMLDKLRKIEQSEKFHPEGSVWEHTMLVVDMAAEGRHLSDHPRVFMWAALLHDLGKAVTTKVRGGRITAYDHDLQGAELARIFLQELTGDEYLIDQVAKMVRWHMQSLYVNKNLPLRQSRPDAGRSARGRNRAFIPLRPSGPWQPEQIGPTDGTCQHQVLSGSMRAIILIPASENQ
jgi:putative nucleotidyltransferase with HDIG domain